MRVQQVTAALAGALLSIGILASCAPESNDPKPMNQQSDSDKPDNPDTDQTSEGNDEPAFPNQDVSKAAQAWLDASNKAKETLDPAPLDELSSPDCENCKRLATHLRDLKENGGGLAGDFAEVTRGTKAPKVDGKTASVTITVERGPWTEASEADAEPQQFEVESYDIEFDLKLENGSWIVTEMLPIVEE